MEGQFELGAVEMAKAMTKQWMSEVFGQSLSSFKTVFGQFLGEALVIKHWRLE